MGSINPRRPSYHYGPYGRTRKVYVLARLLSIIIVGMIDSSIAGRDRFHQLWGMHVSNFARTSHYNLVGCVWNRDERATSRRAAITVRALFNGGQISRGNHRCHRRTSLLER